MVTAREKCLIGFQMTEMAGHLKLNLYHPMILMFQRMKVIFALVVILALPNVLLTGAFYVTSGYVKQPVSEEFYAAFDESERNPHASINVKVKFPCHISVSQ